MTFPVNYILAGNITSPNGSNRSICTALTIAHILLRRKAL
jgi:hypothetical protein